MTLDYRHTCSTRLCWVERWSHLCWNVLLLFSHFLFRVCTFVVLHFGKTFLLVWFFCILIRFFKLTAEPRPQHPEARPIATLMSCKDVDKQHSSAPQNPHLYFFPYDANSAHHLLFLLLTGYATSALLLHPARWTSLLDFVRTAWTVRMFVRLHNHLVSPARWCLFFSVLATLYLSSVRIGPCYPFGRFPCYTQLWSSILWPSGAQTD